MRMSAAAVLRHYADDAGFPLIWWVESTARHALRRLMSGPRVEAERCT
jgi:hypothetical protein